MRGSTKTHAIPPKNNSHLFCPTPIMSKVLKDTHCSFPILGTKQTVYIWLGYRFSRRILPLPISVSMISFDSSASYGKYTTDRGDSLGSPSLNHTTTALSPVSSTTSTSLIYELPFFLPLSLVLFLLCSILDGFPAGGDL